VTRFDGKEENEEDQNTLLYTDGVVYHCSTTNRVTALKATTGQILWQFDPKTVQPTWKRCRTLGYFDPGPGDSCGRRIVMTTVDRRLIELRVSDGKPCESFGVNGVVDFIRLRCRSGHWALPTGTARPCP